MALKDLTEYLSMDPKATQSAGGRIRQLLEHSTCHPERQRGAKVLASVTGSELTNEDSRNWTNEPCNL